MKRKKHRGLIVPSDDLNLGQWYAVHSDTFPFAGMAFRIIAMNLPFVVGRTACNPAQPVTIDTRHLALMKVDDEYANAQRSGEDEP